MPRPSFVSLFSLLTILALRSLTCAAELSVQDDFGRTVVLAHQPQRIVSLSPGLTEALFALGLDNAVVGVSDFCNYPAAALTRPKVGGVTPNVEAIVSLRPDLVVTTGGVAMRDFAKRMARLNIPVVGFEPETIETVFARIATLGRITGHEAAATQLVDELRHRLDAVVAHRVPGPSPRVLYLVDEDPYITIGPRSFLYDVLIQAGARPYETGAGQSYPRIGLESIIRFDPEIIIFADDSDRTMATRVAAWQRWDHISAVRSGRLYGIPRDLVNRPGPRIVDAVEFIAQKLHETHEVSKSTP